MEKGYFRLMNSSRPNRKWHWAYWIIYFFVTHIVFAEERFEPFNLLVTLCFTLHNVGTAYVTIDWWIPRLYQKKRYLLFILVSLGTVFMFAGLLTLSVVGIFSSFVDSSITFFNITDYLDNFYLSSFWSNFSAVTLFLIPYFVLQRIEMERRNNQLEKEKLASELKFLKSQLHPHFLFNALNNIYFLIKKDPETAAEALAGFSNLLRFQLYDANNEYVPLDKEIDYLQQFAEIAQLRKGENFKVNWTLPDNTENIQIAPLLLMPLIENAFKHGSNKNGHINIALQLKNQQLHFRITNSKEVDKSKGIKGFEEGGIGLENIQKRLKLIYPERYEFLTTDDAEEFSVDMKVDLKKNL